MAGRSTSPAPRGFASGICSVYVADADGDADLSFPRRRHPAAEQQAAIRAAGEERRRRPSCKTVRGAPEMDPTIVNDPQYTNMVRAGLTSVRRCPSSCRFPICSIPTPAGTPIRPTDSNTGGGKRHVGNAPVPMELIFPRRRDPAAQADCGLQIQGGTGAKLDCFASPLKSVLRPRQIQIY